MSAPLFDADLYRMLHRGYAGDVDFYLRVCEGAGRVLELGCGDGRVSLPLAESGVSVTGIDLHPEMLAAASADRDDASTEVQGRLRYLQKDISAFTLEPPFDRIIAPYTTLYVLDPDARRACLRCVERHLAPDGVFVFDVYPAEWIREEGSYADPEPLLISRMNYGDRAIEVYEQDAHDVEAQRVSVTYIHEIRDGDEQRTVTYTIDHYYLVLDQIEPTLAEAGLSLVAIEGDFDGGPFEESAERLVVTARRAP